MKVEEDEREAKTPSLLVRKRKGEDEAPWFKMWEKV